MSITAGLCARAKGFVLSTFTELSFWKRWLVRLAVLALIVGVVTWAIALARGNETGPWSIASLKSGGGYLLGFAAGAFVRLFLKVSLLLAVVAAGATWGLSQLGWVDLPWHSLGEVQAAFAVKAQASASWLDSFFQSHLPQSGATAVGVFSGVTQKPRMKVEKDD